MCSGAGAGRGTAAVRCGPNPHSYYSTHTHTVPMMPVLCSVGGGCREGWGRAGQGRAELSWGICT